MVHIVIAYKQQSFLYALVNVSNWTRGDRGWLMHFLVFLGYLVNGMTKYDHFCMWLKLYIFYIQNKKEFLKFRHIFCPFQSILLTGRVHQPAPVVGHVDAALGAG